MTNVEINKRKKNVIDAETVDFSILDKSAMAQLTSKLTEIEAQLKSEDPLNQIPGLTELYAGLFDAYKNSKNQESWEYLINNVIRKHPIINTILLDPCTRHSFERPRGYPGDADLLDYFYRVKNETSKIGLDSDYLAFTINRPAGSAVRARAKLIAEYLDAISEKIKYPKILSIACGHLRELKLSAAFLKGEIGEMVALDHDQVSLDKVMSMYKDFGNVTPIKGSIRTLMKGNDALRNFDFVYSSGFFDYLSEKMAETLTRQMFDLLNPGGTMLVTNFTPSNPDIGYMESFMDWKLIYREFDQIDSLSSVIPSNQIHTKKVFRDDGNNIVYLELVKMR